MACCSCWETIGCTPGDSRFSPEEGGLGYVPEDKVIGKAFVIIWPPAASGWLQ